MIINTGKNARELRGSEYYRLPKWCHFERERLPSCVFRPSNISHTECIVLTQLALYGPMSPGYLCHFFRENSTPWISRHYRAMKLLLETAAKKGLVQECGRDRYCLSPRGKQIMMPGLLFGSNPSRGVYVFAAREKLSVEHQGVVQRIKEMLMGLECWVYIDLHNPADALKIADLIVIPDWGRDIGHMFAVEVVLDPDHRELVESSYKKNCEYGLPIVFVPVYAKDGPALIKILTGSKCKANIVDYWAEFRGASDVVVASWLGNAIDMESVERLIEHHVLSEALNAHEHGAAVGSTTRDDRKYIFAYSRRSGKSRQLGPATPFIEFVVDRINRDLPPPSPDTNWDEYVDFVSGREWLHKPLFQVYASWREYLDKHYDVHELLAKAMLFGPSDEIRVEEDDEGVWWIFYRKQKLCRVTRETRYAIMHPDRAYPLP